MPPPRSAIDCTDTMPERSSEGTALWSTVCSITLRAPIDAEIFVPEPDPVEQMKLQQQYNQQVEQYNAQLLEQNAR